MSPPLRRSTPALAGLLLVVLSAGTARADAIDGTHVHAQAVALLQHDARGPDFHLAFDGLARREPPALVVRMVGAIGQGLGLVELAV